MVRAKNVKAYLPQTGMILHSKLLYQASAQKGSVIFLVMAAIVFV
jgi:hypothetical protein